MLRCCIACERAPVNLALGSEILPAPPHESQNNGSGKNQNISVSLNHYFETAEETSSPVPNICSSYHVSIGTLGGAKKRQTVHQQSTNVRMLSLSTTCHMTTTTTMIMISSISHVFKGESQIIATSKLLQAKTSARACEQLICWDRPCKTYKNQGSQTMGGSMAAGSET